MNKTIESLMRVGLNHPVEMPNAAFTVRNATIEHPNFCEAIRQIAFIHHRGQEAKVAEGLLLVAQTGSGKTTALIYYASRFPREMCGGVRQTIVLLVTTPEHPTVKSLAEAILVALGDPAAEKGSTQTKTRRILYFLERCGVQLLLIDEFQHFSEGRRVAESRRVTDWLKNLFNFACIPVVLCGLPRSIAVVNGNPQLRRRFSSPLYLAPFRFDTKEERRIFRGVLLQIHKAMPVECPPLHAGGLSRRFYYASCGLFDYVVKIVDRAVSMLKASGQRAITQEMFAVAFREAVWRDAPDALNPFVASELRELKLQGEPFDVWDPPERYSASSVVGRS